MVFDVEALLHQLLEGHRVISKIHGENPNKAFRRIVGIFERERRGVRFLPTHVVRRAVRKYKLPASFEIEKLDSGGAACERVKIALRS
jgi:type IV secretory pathway ATPase VirB11/archaellum biosynthesis ATPase